MWRSVEKLSFSKVATIPLSAISLPSTQDHAESTTTKYSVLSYTCSQNLIRSLLLGVSLFQTQKEGVTEERTKESMDLRVEIRHLGLQLRVRMFFSKRLLFQRRRS